MPRRLKLMVATLLLGATAVALAIWQPPQLSGLLRRGQALISIGPDQPVAPPPSQVAATPPAAPSINLTGPGQAPAVQAAKPAAGSPQFIKLNNQAAELVERGQYWPAIALLNQAIKLAPERPEPLINMGVALAELGLYGPAARYLRQAQQMAPDNLKLAENLALLQRAGFLEAAK